jgi:hypothetical protein
MHQVKLAWVDHAYIYSLLSPSFYIYRRRYACHKFDSIYRKYMQYLYLKINLLKN